MSNISAWQHQENVKRMTDLKAKGYKFDITGDGYSVWFGDKFLGGASVKLPRSKPLHWQHRRGNMKDFLDQCLIIIDRMKPLDKLSSVN